MRTILVTLSLGLVVACCGKVDETEGTGTETDADGGIAAEVFAAVKPGNNNKLKKDLKKVSQARANHKYVFFACPGYQPGEQDEDSDYPGVKIVSLGIDFQENPTSGH